MEQVPRSIVREADSPGHRCFAGGGAATWVAKPFLADGIVPMKMSAAESRGARGSRFRVHPRTLERCIAKVCGKLPKITTPTIFTAA